MSPVRTRIAPSPTGPLHIGTARTALFNYLYTRKVGGQFLMRLEDTDIERSTKDFEEQIYEGLKWLGLHWDEGPDIGGPCTPYRQSERADIYKKHLDILIGNGRAYPCFCTAEELEAERKELQSQKLAPKYMDKCRKIPSNEAEKRVADGAPHAYRFAMPEEKIAFHDLIKGDVEFDCSMIGDFVIATADGRYIFHLTNIVDDITMKITHVIRGEDHLSNTPKHIALARAMGCEPPHYGHIPLTLNPDKSKMSKRKGTVDLKEYRAMGYLPEAVVNFLAFLGWSPGTEEEVFSLDELVQRFSIDAMSKSNAIFNIEKLNWINGLYLRRLSKDDLAERLSQYLPCIDMGYLKKIIPLVQDRLKRLDEVVEYAKFFFEDPKDYDVKLIIAKKQTAVESADALKKVKSNLEKLSYFTVHSMEEMMRSLVEELGWKAGPLFMIVRVAITGATATPPLFETMEVLSKDVCLRRIDYAIGKLEASHSG
jgi:glutamyl-tRNA synthetase